MRRFWAHLILAVTTIFACLVSFTNVFVNVKSNIEYHNGYEVVYQVTEKESGPVLDNLTPAQNIAKAFEKRLKDYGVSNYQVMTQGEDNVKVTFADSDDYDAITSLLPFNGTLALTLSISGATAYGSDFLAGKAYIDEINNIYPTVVIPVKTNDPNYKTFVDALKEQKEGGIEEKTGEKDEEGKEKTVTKYYAFMWYDFDADVDNYELAKKDTPEGQHCKSKIIMQFDRDNLYFPDGKNDKLSAVVGITNSAGEATKDTIAGAYKKANLFTSLINAGALDYDVSFQYSSEVANVLPMVENVIYFGDPHAYVAMSQTLIATILSAVVICLFLALFFKIGALGLSATTILALFSAFGFMALTGAEFTTAGVTGLILLAVTSIASGVIYLTKLKNESYKGRSLKKANAEASKKSLLAIVDIHVVLIVVGVFAYIFGGAIMRSFATVTVLGGLVSLIANTFGFKGLMWLATNASGMQGKYNYFGVDTKRVPDFSKEEKQSYFGPFHNKNITKHKKPIAIISGLLFLGSAAGMIAFGLTNKTNNIYNAPSPVRNSEITFKTTEESSPVNKSSTIDDILDRTIVYAPDKTVESGKKLTDYKADLNMYTLSRYEKNESNEYEEVTYYYSVIKLNSAIPVTYMASYDDGRIEPYVAPINDVLEYIMADPTIVGDLKGSAVLNEVEVVSTPQPEYAPIMIGTSVALAVLTLYFMLRYRLSRGLSTVVLPVVASGITLGLFVLTRIVTDSFISLAVPLVGALTLIASVIFLDKEKELINEDRSKQYILEDRQMISKQALCNAVEPIGIVGLCALYIGICFFGFGAKATSTLFIGATFGILVGVGLILTVFVPMSNVLFRKFKKVDWFKMNDKPGKKKKKIKKVSNSSEPEEAIFIGIND